MKIMRPIWITLYAFIIAISSAMFDMRGTVRFEADQIASAPMLKDILHSDSLHATPERYAKNSHLIAQDFIPIVIIAEGYDYNHHFAHYLPLYNLNRQKEYFLLI